MLLSSFDPQVINTNNTFTETQTCVTDFKELPSMAEHSQTGERVTGMSPLAASLTSLHLAGGDIQPH